MNASMSDPSTLPQLSQIVEALLFSSQKAVSLKELLSYFKAAATTNPEGPASAFKQIKEEDLLSALQELRNDLASSTRCFELRETASGWQLVTTAVFAPWLRQLFPEARPSRLSPPALETLAIIAYRQPITRADMEAVRGVAVDGVVQTLMDRGLIRIAGRAEFPGRPLLYSTTQSFLDHFGLRNLEELPNAAELKAVALPQATPIETQKSTTSQEQEIHSTTPNLPTTKEATVPKSEKEEKNNNLMIDATPQDQLSE